MEVGPPFLVNTGPYKRVPAHGPPATATKRRYVKLEAAAKVAEATATCSRWSTLVVRGCYFI